MQTSEQGKLIWGVIDQVDFAFVVIFTLEATLKLVVRAHADVLALALATATVAATATDLRSEPAPTVPPPRRPPLVQFTIRRSVCTASQRTPTSRTHGTC